MPRQDKGMTSSTRPVIFMALQNMSSVQLHDCAYNREYSRTGLIERFCCLLAFNLSLSTMAFVALRRRVLSGWHRGRTQSNPLHLYIISNTSHVFWYHIRPATMPKGVRESETAGSLSRAPMQLKTAYFSHVLAWVIRSSVLYRDQ